MVGYLSFFFGIFGTLLVDKMVILGILQDPMGNYNIHHALIL